ncbi:MAG: LysR family transcriptional regulator [Proteobacteria bacterium]|nr:LysR family transcriptional regulator [Pseudomonadota bacterium]
MMRTNFRELRYVVAVAEYGSITVAAEKVGISQPAISAAIRNVEADLGYQLFVRKAAQAATLTPAGKHFISHAKHLLNEVRDFEKYATGLGREISGQLNVGCYGLTAPFLMPSILKALAAQHESVGVTLYENDLAGVVSDLKGGVTDVAITYDLHPDDAINFEKLFEVSLHVIVGETDPLASENQISLQQLVCRPLILLDLPSEEYWTYVFLMHGLRPSISYRLKSFELVRGMVGAGIGYSFGRLPIIAETSYDGSKIIKKSIKENVPSTSLCLASLKHAQPRRIVDAFAQTCREVYLCDQTLQKKASADR